MPRVLRSRTILGLLILLFSSLATRHSSFLLAQTETASLGGAIRDPKGAVVPDAEVTAVRIETGAVSTTHTNGAGIYYFTGLQPGHYHLMIQKQGFKEIAIKDFELHIQDKLEQNFTLEIGSVNETVTVKASGININITDGTVSTLVNSTIVANMPLNGRSFQDLILLTPGVVSTAPMTYLGAANESGFSVNGQRPDANYYTVDGVSANVSSSAQPARIAGAANSGSLGAVTATGLGTTQALVSVDDMQEFRVQTSSYSAQYGRNPGGQIGVQTRSGTNAFHGDAYDYLRNSAIGQANDWFYTYDGLNHTPGFYATPPLRQNDFGGALGGPVRFPGVYNGKDKTFFFVNYEGLRLTLPFPTQTMFVPDLCVRGLGTGPTSCSAVSTLDGVTVQPAYAAGSGAPAGAKSIQTLLQDFPYPNLIAEYPAPCPPFCGVPNPFAGIGETVIAPVQNSTINTYSIRLDQVLNDKTNLFFRFSNTASNTLVNFANMDGGGPSHNRTYTVGINNIVTERLSNEFRFNYSSSVTTLASGPIATPYSNAAITACPTVNPNLNNCGMGGSTVPISGSFPAYFGLPSNFTVNFLPVISLGANSLLLDTTSGYNKESQWNPVDTVSYVVGSHLFKFGVDYRRIPGTILKPDTAGFTLDLAALNNGVFDPPNSSPAPQGSTQITYLLHGNYYPVYTNFSAFAEDTWKATPRFTLDYGLRWDVNPAPGVSQGAAPLTLTGSVPYAGTSAVPFGLASAGTPLWRTTWSNFSPRLGAAYQLRPNHGRQTVLRGGFGVFYDTGQQDGPLAFSNPGYSSEPSTTNFLTGCTFPGFGVTGCTAANPGNLPQLSSATSPTSTLYGFNPHLQLPYTLQWNVALEQQLGRAQSLSLSYVGSHAARLLEELQYGIPSPLPTGTTPDLNGQVFYVVQSALTSDYDALQVHFQRQLSHGLTALVSYTWSHCIDYGSVNFEVGFQRGNCDYDIRHNLSASFSYSVPNIGGGNKIAGAILDHWGVDDYFIARTGYPMFLQGVPFNNAFTGLPENSPVYEVNGQPQWLYGSNCISTLKMLGELAGVPGSTVCPGGKALNPCAFASQEQLSAPSAAPVYVPINGGCPNAQPPAGRGQPSTYPVADIGGQAPRNGLFGLGAWQMNMAIRREFPIHDRLKLQFRAEAFNIFNHPNFGPFTSTIGRAPNFGLVTQTLASAAGAPSGAESVQYQFGGPRAMQFALKLIF